MKVKEFGFQIPPDFVASSNEKLRPSLEGEYEALRQSLTRRGTLEALGMSLDEVTERVAAFTVAVPSWGVGTGGTRFGRFPGPGEPEDVFQKLADIATIHQLSGGAPRVSLHIPWDKTKDPLELKEHAAALHLGFDAMNSNTFQDQPGQKLSYKFGSLSHTDPAVRAQAIEHNLEVMEFGRAIGSTALTIWIGDGGDYPGQVHFRRSLERLIGSFGEIYRRLPAGWRLFTEHKPYEPAFYSTVVQDWGTSLMICNELGDRAFALVDLGHHLPGTNIEMVIARLIRARKLGGFHLNDSKYGDDDLTAGSIKPYQLFLIFHELVDAEMDPQVDKRTFHPAYMIDQSHNTKDPIEALIATVEETRRAYAKALLVDKKQLDGLQDSNDVLGAELELKNAYETDVRPVLAMARFRHGAAIDPVGAFRASGYRRKKAEERKADSKLGGGIL
jgi:L-rhamnose isomerase/sugar isomerase